MRYRRRKNKRLLRVASHGKVSLLGGGEPLRVSSIYAPGCN